MAEERIRYRKLPGTRRGILMGSSVWMGPDHLLLVKSSRFREEYKRFYLRDIQSIGVAETARFHISTRSLVIGALWTIAFSMALGMSELQKTPAAWIVGGIGVLLIFAWIFISAGYSCRCRIFTAVSSEDLPSIYRTWTARRFLEQVEPYIGQVQGVIEGNWVEAAEERRIGPLVEGRIAVSQPIPAPVPRMAATPGMVLLPGEVPPDLAAFPGTPGASSALSPEAVPPVVARSRTIPTMLFVASLLVGGAAELLTIRSSILMARWVFVSSVLLQVGTAIGVLVQNFQGEVRPALRNLAIILFVTTGLWYYAAQVASSMAISLAQQRHPENTQISFQETQMAFLSFSWSRGAAGVIHLLLGLSGVVLLLRGDREDQPVSFNV